MLIKTVTAVITTNSAGQTVESLPVRQAVAGETDIAGRPVDAIVVEESEVGVPVRFVTGKAALNSAGQWVDTIPVSGGVAPIDPPYPAPSGYEWALVVENGNQVVESGNRVIELKRAA